MDAESSRPSSSGSQTPSDYSPLIIITGDSVRDLHVAIQDDIGECKFGGGDFGEDELGERKTRFRVTDSAIFVRGEPHGLLPDRNERILLRVDSALGTASSAFARDQFERLWREMILAIPAGKNTKNLRGTPDLPWVETLECEARRRAFDAQELQNGRFTENADLAGRAPPAPVAAREEERVPSYAAFNLRGPNVVVVGDEHGKLYPKQLVAKLITEKMEGVKFCFLEGIHPEYQLVINEWYDNPKEDDDLLHRVFEQCGNPDSIESKIALMNFLKSREIKPIGINIHTQTTREIRDGGAGPEAPRVLEGDLALAYCISAAAQKEPIAPRSKAICLVGDAHVPGITRHIQRLIGAEAEGIQVKERLGGVIVPGADPTAIPPVIAIERVDGAPANIKTFTITTGRDGKILAPLPVVRGARAGAAASASAGPVQQL